MTQNDLNRAVAHATGETVSTIKRIGFLVEEPSITVDDASDPALGPRVLDWDGDARDPEPIAVAA